MSKKLKILRIKHIHEAMLPDILSTTQVEDYTGLSHSNVNNLMKKYEDGIQGGIPNFWMGGRRMARKSELLKWIKAREQEMLWHRQGNRKKGKNQCQSSY
jgi:hypothetical protein